MNIASRLMHAAKPDQIFVDHMTHIFTQFKYAYSACVEMDIKGKGVVAVYALQQ